MWLSVHRSSLVAPRRCDIADQASPKQCRTLERNPRTRKGGGGRSKVVPRCVFAKLRSVPRSSFRQLGGPSWVETGPDWSNRARIQPSQNQMWTTSAYIPQCWSNSGQYRWTSVLLRLIPNQLWPQCADLGANAVGIEHHATVRPPNLASVCPKAATGQYSIDAGPSVGDLNRTCLKLCRCLATFDPNLVDSGQEGEH